MLILLVAGITIVRTDWFRNMVREKIIAAVEDSTGGRVEIGAFVFDWTHLRAKVSNLVLHGLEPANVPPLFRADLLQVDLKLLSPFRGFVDIAYLLVEKPQANVIVSTDGRTNVPAPKVPGKGDKTALQTVVDLAIGKFDLRSGNFVFGDRKSDLNASGENLRAQLDFNRLTSRYSGQVDLNPLFINRLPVNVKLPVTLEKDRIAFDNAVLSSPLSRITITGSMEHLASPRTDAHVVAQIALDEVNRAAALGVNLDTVHGPSTLMADLNATVDQSVVHVKNAHIALGQTTLEASGSTQQAEFQGMLALGELGRLLRLSVRPEGTVRLGGTASYSSATQYHVDANLEARGVAFRQGATHISGVSLNSNVVADPDHIGLNGLRLGAFGGTLTGSGTLEDLDRFRLSGRLNHFDIAELARTFAAKPLGYDGLISGPLQAQGSVKTPSSMMAHVVLGIAPGKRGIPVSGKIDADYNGRADTITLARSFLALPNTRVDLQGALGRSVQVRVVTRDLGDLQPLAGDLPVKFNPGGSAIVTATATGSLSSPRVSGDVLATRFSAEGRPFTRLATSFDLSRSGAEVSNGSLSQGALQATFAGAIGLRNWKPVDSAPLRADVSVRNADAQDVLALAGQSASVPLSGALTADVHVNGTLGDPLGNAQLSVVRGAIQGEPFDSLSVNAVMTHGAITVPSLALIAGSSRIDANVAYQHAPGTLSQGTFRAHVNSNQVQLAQFQNLVKDRPGLRGILNLNADASGQIAGAVQLTSLNANAGVRGLELEGQRLGDLTLTAATAGQNVEYNLNSNFAGSSIRLTGRSQLDGQHATDARFQIANLPIDRVLAIAGRRDLAVSGSLSADGDFSGTAAAPQASVNLTVTNAKAFDEPISRLQGAVSYTNQAVRVTDLRVTHTAGNIELTASLDHPAGKLNEGRAQFQVRSSRIQLAAIHALHQAKPGLAGTAEISADGEATLRAGAAPLFSRLDARVAANGVSLDKRPLGDLTATAQTQGREVLFAVDSNFARSTIKGAGRLQLANGYPVDARIDIANVTYSGINAWMQNTVQTFDGSLDGQVTLNGPLQRTQDLRGTIRVTKLEAHSVASASGRKPRVKLELHNEGPIVAALERGVVTIQSAKIEGPSTHLALSGSAPLDAIAPVNLRVEGDVKLDVLQAFNPDIFSAGSVTLNAAVAGSRTKPVVNGRLQLQNAAFNMVDLPNGISNANGIVNFNGTEAVIQNLSGETGGGKIELSGFAAYGGPELQFRVLATASGIHVAYPPTVTTQASARLTLAGTSARSLVSGTVVIQDVALHSHSDMGSLLNSAAAPPSPANVSSGLLSGMRFDIKIQTSPDIQFRTTLTENLQADANLTLRGTPDHPGMLGRVTVTQGEVVFAGTKYNIDQGTVTFFNPQKIEPVLNVDLTTTVQGVDVSLSVSGPVDRMKLSYRSDPPLQFTEIVSLLGSGKPPTSDPVLAARTPVAPQQSLGQTGVSTLFGAAVANPVSGRLQRLFGVSKLKIDPQLTGASNTPQATLTLQQQITRELTFTYIQDVTQSNSQIIRVEWAISPQWSAIAARDRNGQFDVDLFYKKRLW
ncbi:MAG: translocation/assembly module TamB domain-containing protein [Candidatus Solibacter sp.]